MLITSWCRSRKPQDTQEELQKTGYDGTSISIPTSRETRASATGKIVVQVDRERGSIKQLINTTGSQGVDSESGVMETTVSSGRSRELTGHAMRGKNDAWIKWNHQRSISEKALQSMKSSILYSLPNHSLKITSTSFSPTLRNALHLVLANAMEPIRLRPISETQPSRNVLSEVHAHRSRPYTNDFDRISTDDAQVEQPTLESSEDETKSETFGKTSFEGIGDGSGYEPEVNLREEFHNAETSRIRAQLDLALKCVGEYENSQLKHLEAHEKSIANGNNERRKLKKELSELKKKEKTYIYQLEELTKELHRSETFKAEILTNFNALVGVVHDLVLENRNLREISTENHQIEESLDDSPGFDSLLSQTSCTGLSLMEEIAKVHPDPMERDVLEQISGLYQSELQEDCQNSQADRRPTKCYVQTETFDDQARREDTPKLVEGPGSDEDAAQDSKNERDIGIKDESLLSSLEGFDPTLMDPWRGENSSPTLSVGSNTSISASSNTEHRDSLRVETEEGEELPRINPTSPRHCVITDEDVFRFMCLIQSLLDQHVENTNSLFEDFRQTTFEWQQHHHDVQFHRLQHLRLRQEDQELQQQYLRYQIYELKAKSIGSTAITITIAIAIATTIIMERVMFAAKKNYDYTKI
ncbi:hypothetical protein BGZ80_001873 [Entomortierella chlamydospora]|uniref:Uncharacterized protein n=1 Tax=Entomortierella chlamydospora TaxID=101097 RepID=A0A9P6T367_9FUNG|nr:hypothetical protein BGZ80_001873 [Entomortierella chlamydospora]